MKTLLKILILAQLATGVAVADPVAWVQQLYGGKHLTYREGESGNWYRAYLDQNADIGTFFKTDPQSTANLMFFLGGKAVLDKGCEIKLISARNAQVISQGLEVKQGNFWAKFDKQKGSPIRIRTAGGVMGIKGTEFVVQVAPDGSTKLSLIEGEVTVDDNNGQSFTAEPGNEVTFGPNTPMLTRLYSLEELMENLHSDLGPSFDALRSELHEFRDAWAKQNLPFRTAELEVKILQEQARIAELNHDLKERRRLEALIRVAGDTVIPAGENPSGTSGGATAGDTDTGSVGSEVENLNHKFDELLQKLDAKRDPENRAQPNPDERTAETHPDEQTAQNNPQTAQKPLKPLFTTGSFPELAWKLPPAEQYTVVFLDPENDEEVYWVGETSRSSYVLPNDAKPLADGIYRFRIIPTDSQGRAKEDGNALEGAFRVEG